MVARGWMSTPGKARAWGAQAKERRRRCIRIALAVGALFVVGARSSRRSLSYALTRAAALARRVAWVNIRSCCARGELEQGRTRSRVVQWRRRRRLFCSRWPKQLDVEIVRRDHVCALGVLTRG